MKQKRKLKNSYRLSNKRLLIVAIGLVLVLTLAIASMVYKGSYRVSELQQTATALGGLWDVPKTATQSAIHIATQTAEAP